MGTARFRFLVRVRHARWEAWMSSTARQLDAGVVLAAAAAAMCTCCRVADPREWSDDLSPPKGRGFVADSDAVFFRGSRFSCLLPVSSCGGARQGGRGDVTVAEDDGRAARFQRVAVGDGPWRNYAAVS
jgi:hypothetical protein